MKKYLKIVLALAVAAILAVTYFSENKSDKPITKSKTIVQNEKQSSNVKTKETYKPAHGEESEIVDTSAEGESKVKENKNPEQKKTDSVEKSVEQKASDTVKNICTLSVRCDTAIGKVAAEKENIIPHSGVILPETKVEIKDGDSVFDVLLRETKANKIHMEFSKTPAYDNVYIEGIGNLYEFDCGELSGWMYRVNGEFPQYSCSEFKVSAGDKIEFVYTCNLGRDIGGNAAN